MKLNIKNRLILTRIVLVYLFIFSMPLAAQQIAYTNGNDSWNPDVLGNHRAIVQYSGKGAVAKVTVEWRRRDENPEQKRIIVQDATGKNILNVKTADINRETGTVFLSPFLVKGLILFTICLI